MRPTPCEMRERNILPIRWFSAIDNYSITHSVSSGLKLSLPNRANDLKSLREISGTCPYNPSVARGLRHMTTPNNRRRPRRAIRCSSSRRRISLLPRWTEAAAASR